MTGQTGLSTNHKRAKHLPAGPIRQALQQLNRRLSRTEMARLWALRTDRDIKSCERALNLIMLHKDRVLDVHVDELCLYVLGEWPTNLYPEEW